jgi:hypothetical protein
MRKTVPTPAGGAAIAGTENSTKEGSPLVRRETGERGVIGMKTPVRRAVFGLLLAASMSSVGCQTYQLGQVLPSPGILRDDLQYFPKGPTFPLSNELNAMSSAESERQGNNNR